jgi:hypothetical protein
MKPSKCVVGHEELRGFGASLEVATMGSIKGEVVVDPSDSAPQPSIWWMKQSLLSWKWLHLGVLRWQVRGLWGYTWRQRHGRWVFTPFSFDSVRVSESLVQHQVLLQKQMPSLGWLLLTLEGLFLRFSNILLKGFLIASQYLLW